MTHAGSTKYPLDSGTAVQNEKKVVQDKRHKRSPLWCTRPLVFFVPIQKHMTPKTSAPPKWALHHIVPPRTAPTILPHTPGTTPKHPTSMGSTCKSHRHNIKSTTPHRRRPTIAVSASHVITCCCVRKTILQYRKILVAFIFVSVFFLPGCSNPCRFRRRR